MIVFREATPGDFEDIARLYRQLQPADPIVHDGSDKAAFAQILANPGLYLFVLEADGAVAATTYLNVIPNLTRSASPYAVIENVVVERRCGAPASASRSWRARSGPHGTRAATRRC
jgi:hypothetical protein